MFSLKDFVKTGFLKAVGKMEEDLAEIQPAIGTQYVAGSEASNE